MRELTTSAHQSLNDRVSKIEAGKTTTLFCIPYAGGNAFFYRPLAEFCPDTIHVCPLELPGRGRRSREALLVTLDALADDLIAQLRPLIAGGRYALFGHSMGALLAYLCAARISEAGLMPPEALFLSAMGAPAKAPERSQTPRHLLPRDDFVQILRDLGGCPPEVLNEPKLLGYFEPILRADFQAVDTWRQSRSQARLDVPIVVLNGDRDICRDSSAAWARETSADFRMHVFEGEHFYILQNWRRVAEVIAERLKA